MRCYLFNAGADPINGSLDFFPIHGDGLFETIRVTEGRMPFWSLHAERLQSGMTTLQIPLSMTTIEQCLLSVLDAEANAGHFDGGNFKLRIQVIRASTADYQGYRCAQSSPFIKIDVSAVTLFEFRSIDVCLSGVKLSSQPLLAGIKHCNRLEQVLAAQDLDANNRRRTKDNSDAIPFDDALLFDGKGKLVEAISSNVFVLINNQWLTPVLEASGVKGTVRAWLMQTGFPKLALAVRETDISYDNLRDAGALFVCNAVRGIHPIKSVTFSDGDQRVYQSSETIRQLSDIMCQARMSECELRR